MNLNLNTRLKGVIALSDTYHADSSLQKNQSLYKFVWVREGDITIEIDHQPITLKKSEIISLSNLHHLTIKEVNGDYLVLLFNSNFYCIYGNDHEVSCSGFLFNGTSHIIQFKLTEEETNIFEELLGGFNREFQVKDNLQEEMLRILLKRFIIYSTRIARVHLNITQEKEKSFDIIRQFFVLVDQYFKEKKQVQDYADMLNKSPKTLSNLFSLYKLPSPLKIIHERTEAEAKRLLLYSSKSSKEIADILGFEDQASFSRFFKNMTGQSVTQFKLSSAENGKN